VEDRIVEAFARSIFAKVELVRAVEFSRRDRARVLEGINQDIRKYSDLMDPEASDAALALGAKMGVDLRGARWHDQNKFDPGRDLFLLEHVVTVKVIRDACLEAQSEADVAMALALARIAWICRAEDDELTRLGFRSKRPDPVAAYRAAGIALAGFTYDAPTKTSPVEDHS
jgi:hypothetical protein